MKKIKTAVVAVLILALIPLQVNGSNFWMGNGVYYQDKYLEWWNVTSDEIIKEIAPGRVYSINDLATYSAYYTDFEEDVGNDVSKAFKWMNKSRLGYVKMVKVNPGQEVSFLFSEERYVYCAEFTGDYKLIKTGEWISTGDVFKLQNTTEWIMMVFRMPNGNLENNSGFFDYIYVEDIANLEHKYLILEPFNYTFKLNGGTWEGSKQDLILNRLGVETMVLPVPYKDGYEFMGWISSGGSVYTGSLQPEYKSDLFRDNTFNATWRVIKVEGLELSETEIVLEENSEETFQLIAQVQPYNALDKSIEWSSADTTIATVDDNGIVHPKKSGVTTITATTGNGIKATCKVYVMGFEVTVPSYCEINQVYEIKVEIYNNGKETTPRRKRIVLWADDEIELIRKGDLSTTCQVLSETALEYGGSYNKVNSCILDTQVSTQLYFKLRPKNSVKKSGDYEGDITFTVSVE